MVWDITDEVNSISSLQKIQDLNHLVYIILCRASVIPLEQALPSGLISALQI